MSDPDRDSVIDADADRGRDFVIDADVARAANAEAIVQLKHGDGAFIAQARRAALSAILKARHRAIFSPRLHGEWFRPDGRSPSGGAREWYTRMFERRLIVRLEAEPATADLSDAIDKHLPADVCPLAHKDAHLVAIACAHDHRILSGDDRARAQFARLAAQTGPPLSNLHWLNPIAPEVVPWLLERAPDHAPYHLAPPAP